MIKKKFKSPYIGTDTRNGLTLLYTNNGNFSCVLKIENVAEQYGADYDAYATQHEIYMYMIKILGHGYIIQKTDIIPNLPYKKPEETKTDFLSEKYFQYYEGRQYKRIETYLTITKEMPKSRVFQYNEAEVKAFEDRLNKIIMTFKNKRFKCQVLDQQQIELMLRKFFSFNFNSENLTYSNIRPENDGVYIGEKKVEIISLFDIDELNIPSSIKVATIDGSIGKNFPIGNMGFIYNAKEAETILYNQVIQIPHQLTTKDQLERKKKRHTSMPDAANHVSVEDIDSMFIDIAKNNEMLVYAHFSVFIYGDPENVRKAKVTIETGLNSIGIIPGRNDYHQWELFQYALFGNTGDMKEYDKFLTSRPAAVCFFFNERQAVSEESNTLFYFTNRIGIPIAIDIFDKPWSTGRITNRNFFTIGPSGSGKSFFINTMASQMLRMDSDLMIVDTGHSYYGLCAYVGGKYITYDETKPISMNPFKTKLDECDQEFKDSVKSIIGVIWKGTNGTLSEIENTTLHTVINNYYISFFKGEAEYKELNFNSFYEYSTKAIKDIMETKGIEFDLNEYAFILEKFYRGGIYDTMLNEEADTTLMDEKFIVFEIDSIKENKMLFPIVTIIIMGVFIQKMRHKKNRKVLIIEEAWKAIASPMMVSNIQYLYKTVRKWNGSVGMVTQEIEDIISSEVLKKSVINNSDILMLLDQRKFKDTFDDIAKVLALNEVECNKIFTINNLDNKAGRRRFSEFYLRRGNVGEVYGIELPVAEYMTYTTDRTEREVLKIYLKEYDFNYNEAIQALVDDYEASGLDFFDFIRKCSEKPNIKKHLLSA
jgi:conjugation system TraG family ATPase